MVFRPDKFGKYLLLKRIAIGGMAEVFRAKVFGAEGFEKIVAIKRMLSHLSADEQFVHMFINEAKLTASLSHANIAQIYDFGCIENLYFLSMEFVNGKDLADLIRMLREKSLMAPIELSCYVIIETLAGLDYAHRKTDPYGTPLNLIHRDMSPHNLLISYEGEVKIVDFGIAKATSTTVHTTSGVLKGKYSYMSPEQAHGAQLDHRSDIFSLGICFYELLTLTKMFQGSSDLSVLEKVRETDFVRPREINPEIPKELEELLLKALAKKPEDRWQTSSQWREALEGFLFSSKLHYSASWLSGFMTNIFRQDLESDMAELASEAEFANKYRVSASRAARVEAIRESVDSLSNDDDDDEDYLQTEMAEAPMLVNNDVKIAKLSSVDVLEDLDDDSDLNAMPDLSTLEDSNDEENLPTIQVSFAGDQIDSIEEELLRRRAQANADIPITPDTFADKKPAVATSETKNEREVFNDPLLSLAAEEPSILSDPSLPSLEIDPSFRMDASLGIGPAFDISPQERTGERALDPKDFGYDLVSLQQQQEHLQGDFRPEARGFNLHAVVVVFLCAALGLGIALVWPQDDSPTSSDAGTRMASMMSSEQKDALGDSSPVEAGPDSADFTLLRDRAEPLAPVQTVDQPEPK